MKVNVVSFYFIVVAVSISLLWPWLVVTSFCMRFFSSCNIVLTKPDVDISIDAQQNYVDCMERTAQELSTLSSLGHGLALTPPPHTHTHERMHACTHAHTHTAVKLSKIQRA